MLPSVTCTCVIIVPPVSIGSNVPVDPVDYSWWTRGYRWEKYGQRGSLDSQGEAPNVPASAMGSVRLTTGSAGDGLGFYIPMTGLMMTRHLS